MPQPVGLRAVNVAGHTIRMADLRRVFERSGSGRRTFIASGSVLFETAEADQEKLETRHRRARADSLPISVVRSIASSRACRHRPFDRGSRGDGRSVYVAFLARHPTAEAIRRLVDQASDDDTFAVVGREAWWLRRGGIGTSRFSAGFLEKTLGLPATLRGKPTILRLIAKAG
jgi:uncharacterized protein (DUF1697 family)